MLETSFSPWPSYTQEEADAISRVLLSNRVNYWTGVEVRHFEKEFSQFSDCNYAIGVANGTLALDLALRALEIGRGDEVIVTARTFLASASSIVVAGGTPIFADVDRNTQNITAETIEEKITSKTKAIIVVHLAGMPADMDPIMSLAEEYNLCVIEDCAQAHGARYKGKSVGSIGHVGAWSFCQDKIMTTGGEGGMVTTNDETLWSKMWSYKDHGKSWNAVYKKTHPPGFRWVHESIGTNWRMTEIQGVIGRIQLKKIKNWQEKRIDNAMKIWKTADKLPWIRAPLIPNDITHAAYKAYLFIVPDALSSDWTRDKIIELISSENVPVYSGSCSEVYLEKAFVDLGICPSTRLKISQELGETSIMFLVHPTLTSDEIDRTCKSLIKVGRQICM